MYLSDSHARLGPPLKRRQFERYDIQCRARILIGTRQYAGYIHNISQAGAKLRTISPIRKLGAVILRLPDLAPLRCRLRWTDSYNAGVSFELVLAPEQLSRWARGRSASRELNEALEAEIAELTELVV